LIRKCVVRRCKIEQNRHGKSRFLIESARSWEALATRQMDTSKADCQHAIDRIESQAASVTGRETFS
jgi:uncharacterized protein YegP (UPF0339 family)